MRLKEEFEDLKAYYISIHAPIVGCDGYKIITFYDPNDFNPRTHRGVRPNYDDDDVVIHKISIHAPIVGCDGGTLKLGSNLNQFQSTHPSWGATQEARRGVFIFKNFNPRTHRGVRLFETSTYPFAVKISIHAPIVGCDTRFWLLMHYQRKFQSTHPSWGAT